MVTDELAIHRRVFDDEHFLLTASIALHLRERRRRRWIRVPLHFRFGRWGNGDPQSLSWQAGPERSGTQATQGSLRRSAKDAGSFSGFEDLPPQRGFARAVCRTPWQ